MRRLAPLNRALGFTMIEILVTLFVTAFGLLGLAGFVVRASTLSTDAVQRARAAILVNDMATRLSNSKAVAGNFVTAQLHGATVRDCGAEVEAGRQLCEWNNLLAGANDGGSGARALGFRGCVTRPNPVDPLFIVTVTWGSISSGTPPADQCGTGVFGADDSQRRVLRLPVRVAAMTA
jgi:type IV pilus assembly protein PilV